MSGNVVASPSIWLLSLTCRVIDIDIEMEDCISYKLFFSSAVEYHHWKLSYLSTVLKAVGSGIYSS